jgi:hypothetical protein
MEKHEGSMWAMRFEGMEKRERASAMCKMGREKKELTPDMMAFL